MYNDTFPTLLSLGLFYMYSTYMYFCFHQFSSIRAICNQDQDGYDRFCYLYKWAELCSFSFFFFNFS
ncbi:uncharacterized protein BDW43DRAFT_191298 [Aspergillus alliaceus]|uniref:uncharacterized protein n=1 Tax=Petromyces alliaceus TaxID=209559 RepID=UPI0012A4227E|nr:uncharacterized protein BDW43DRAFT_191298 [Aspergillus alliaceus]KAB8229277.1 hypothetical protein BDW43DRAFT_191298 [Aspergillus alliaceus]